MGPTVPLAELTVATLLVVPGIRWLALALQQDYVPAMGLSSMQLPMKTRHNSLAPEGPNSGATDLSHVEPSIQQLAWHTSHTSPR